MQKLPIFYNAAYIPQNLVSPLQTQCITHVNGNKSSTEMHYHSCAEIGLCTAGSGIFFIGDRIQSFARGCISFLPSNAIHIAQSPDESPSEWKFIFVDLAALDIENPSDMGMVLADSDCVHLFNMLFDELTLKQTQYQEMATCLIKCLIIRLQRAEAQLQCNIEKKYLNDILPAINYISKNYNSDIRVEQLATMCCISPSLFYRIFHAATGMSPIKYLNSVRISSAENLLKFSYSSILDIAAEVGFSNVSSFFRQFKKANVISPKEYRNRYSNIHI